MHGICSKMVGIKLVKFLSSSNDLELYWSYAQIIFLAGFPSQKESKQDATMARWS